MRLKHEYESLKTKQLYKDKMNDVSKYINVFNC